ncbi:M48 family metallopeptidase [Crenobacter sp. SG2305]|uniref:M48 family metallopeptidase n=1 Tax=Crenobacter oryzisoli TaxID=3056844 RepID=UPI0025AACB55|nr:M48 family metallopeptidase [Crenobacter sp. SG2305]MDN0083727.1 M48 family metallopeptidase [Crenobacter sp. SG2305]
MRTGWVSLSLAALLGAGLISGCQSTTYGGATHSSRSQFLMVPSAEVNQSAALAYNKELTKARSAGTLNTNKAYVARVNAISRRLIAQVGVFRPDALSWPWQVNVFQSDEVNAFCMPGGKIGVYSGLIDKLKLTDDELAAVLGHEISHALREHSREQMSQEVAKQEGLSIVGALAGLSGGAIDLANVASKFVFTLPFSRTMESEADIMGLELMARAGYNPEAAVDVWRKMEQLGKSGAELLSTHPSSATRIQDLQSHLPQVMPLYEAAKNKYRSTP